MICMEPETQNTVLVISENGYGKRSLLDAYRMTKRAREGSKDDQCDREWSANSSEFLSVNDDKRHNDHQ